MGLELFLDPGGTRLAAREFQFERRVGESVRIRVTATPPPDSNGRKTLADQLAQPGLTLRAEAAGASLGPPGAVVSVNWQLEGPELCVEAVTTGWGDHGDDEHPLLPRSRVHRVANLKELIDVFAHVALPYKGVRHDFESITFADGDKACAIQADLSDWEYLHAVLAQFPRLYGQGRTAPVLSGGSDPDAGTERRWRITWGDKASHARQNDVDPLFVKSSNFDHREFATLEEPGDVPLPAERISRSVSFIRRDQEFDAGEWDTWRKRDVPFFHGPKKLFVWRVRDHIEGQTGRVTWTRWVDHLPDDRAVPGSTRPVRSLAWGAVGEVTKNSSKEPWIEARVPGFVDGEDVVTARLVTPYGGKDQVSGVHFVPEVGTQVLLFWPGRLGASITCLGNVRQGAVTLEAPSLVLERDIHLKLDRVDALEVGKIDVGSDLAIAVSKTTTIDSTLKMKLAAQGHVATMEGGIMRMGESS